jgi:hypothetical protein
MKQLSLFYCSICIVLVASCSDAPKYTSSYPKSDLISDVKFDFGSLVELAPGSDNWAITWGKDGHQYTTFGDGGGFGGDNGRGRVSMGVARIEGPLDGFNATNVWGGYQSVAPAQFAGKSYGLLAVDDVLWMWRTGDASNDSAFRQQEVHYSKDGGEHWAYAGVRFDEKDFIGSRPFFAPTFLQFGAGYAGSRDDYVYSYAPDVVQIEWEVQKPGHITLIRVPRDKIGLRDQYEFFAGFDSKNEPVWSKDVNSRSAVFSDPNGVMRTSVSYNPGLKRYLLITQQITRMTDGYIGIYESKAPWGPWRKVIFENAWDIGLQNGKKNVFWNFSNKWSSPDGRRFTLVYTGRGSDNFGAVAGEFILADQYAEGQ